MKLKFTFSKTALAVLGGGVLVAASGGLFIIYQSQVNQQEELSSQLALTRQKISQINTAELAQQKAGLNTQLLSIQEDAANAEAALFHDLNQIDDVGKLYRIAFSCDVEIESVTAADTASGAIVKVPLK